MGRLTEKSKKVFEYVKENDTGDGLTLETIANGTGLTVKAVGPIVWTALQEKKDGSRGALVSYEKRQVQDKTIGYVHITPLGREYESESEEEDIESIE